MVQEKLVLVLPELGCVACVPKIESAVRMQKGVIWAILNYAAQEITIIYDPAIVGSNQVLEAVRKLGLDPGLQNARVAVSPQQVSQGSGMNSSGPARPQGSSSALARSEQGRWRHRLAFLHR